MERPKARVTKSKRLAHLKKVCHLGVQARIANSKRKAAEIESINALTMSMGNTSIAPVVVKQCQVNLTRLSSIQMADTDEASQVNAFGQDVEYGAVSDGPRLDIEGSSDVEIRCDNKDDDDGIDGVANCDISYADVNDDENATSETKKDAPSFSAESISDVEMVKVGGRKKQRPIRKFRPTMSKMQELSQRQNNEFVISSGALNEESYLRQTEWLKNYKISKKFIPICSYCLADIESPSALEKKSQRDP